VADLPIRNVEMSLRVIAIFGDRSQPPQGRSTLESLKKKITII